MTRRLSETDLGNWREQPHSDWAFQNVRQLMATAPIAAAKDASKLEVSGQGLKELEFDLPQGQSQGQGNLDDLMKFSYTNGLIVLHQGKVVHQQSADHFDVQNPHVIFSVSKSLTAILAGILEDQGLIDNKKLVSHYLPAAKNSAYGDSTLQQVLDMTVALNFEENYTDPQSEYVRYRKATAWNPENLTEPGPSLEPFLYSLTKSSDPHGHAFTYRSPNSDLLALLLERVSDTPFPQLMSELLWQPMGAEIDAYVTLDRVGLSRGAGGICASLVDMARIGQLFLDNGCVAGKQIISERWLHDTCNNGDREAWLRGNYRDKFPHGKYRNKWYQVGDEDDSIYGRGIHGQLVCINPARSVVIVRLSSHPDPLNEITTDCMVAAFDKIAKSLA